MRKNFSITNFIIAINVYIYFFASFTNQTSLYIYNMAIGSPVTEPLITFVTSAFMHGSITHLALNMMFLYYVGPVLEKYLGKSMFLGYYLFTAFVSGFITSFLSDVPVIGASGVLYAMMATVIALDYSNAKNFYINGRSFVNLLLLNVVISFVIPGVSIMGHLSGIIAGVIAAIIILIIKEKRVV